MMSFCYHKQPYKSIMLQDRAVFRELVGHLELPSWVTSLKGAALLPLSLSVPAWQKEKPAPIKNRKHRKYLTAKELCNDLKNNRRREEVKGTKHREREKRDRRVPPG